LRVPTTGDAGFIFSANKRKGKDPLFCHVSDVVGALMKLIDHSDSVGDVFNIGASDEVPILDLAKTLKRLTKSESEVILFSYDEAYEEGFEAMPRCVLDTNRINKLIGLRPSRTLDEIVRSVIDFQRIGYFALDSDVVYGSAPLL
jgi:UDP-glucose 4-epimerase